MHRMDRTLIWFMINVLIFKRSLTCPATCDITGITNVCNILGGTVYYGHCYYWAQTKHTSIDDNINECKSLNFTYLTPVINLAVANIKSSGSSLGVTVLGVSLSVSINGITVPFSVNNVALRIANFYTKEAYVTVMNNFTFPSNNMILRIGLITDINRDGSTDLSNYIWINDTTRISLGQMSWNTGLSNIVSGVTKNSGPTCATINYTGSKSPPFGLENCNGSAQRDQLCEILCIDDPYPCGNCPGSIPQEMNNVYCDDSITSTVKTTSITSTKNTIKPTTSKYDDTVCTSLPISSWYNVAFRGDCYFIPDIKSDWQTSLSWCRQFGTDQGNKTCRLADFDNFDDLKYVSGAQMLGTNIDNGKRVWIGMKTSCYCTTNANDYFWTTSANTTFKAVNSTFQDNMGEFDNISSETCVTVQSTGNMNNQDCKNSDTYFMCRFVFIPGIPAVNVTGCSTNMTQLNTVSGGSCPSPTTISSTETKLTTMAKLNVSSVASTKIKELSTKITEASAVKSMELSTKVITEASTTVEYIGLTVQSQSQSLTQFTNEQVQLLTANSIELITKSTTEWINDGFISSTYRIEDPIETSQKLQNFTTTLNSLITSTHRIEDPAETSQKETTSNSQDITIGYPKCYVSIWSAFSSCSQTCGLSATKIRNRTVVIIQNGSICPNSDEIINCNLDECNPMSPVAQTVALVLQILGCSWLIGICTVCFAISILLKSWDVSRVIHASEEIALILAHLLILSARHETKKKLLCTWASIGMQYFFLVLFAFISLEAAEMYAMVTTVTSENNFFNRSTVAFIGWGLPIIIVITTIFTSFNHYISTFSCWLNFGHPICFGTFVPVIACTCTAAVILESAGQHLSSDFAFGNSAQVTSAKINQRSLLVMIPLQITTWFFGQSAVYYQNIGLFSTVFGLHVALGCAVGFFHILANAEGRAFVEKLFKKVKIAK